MNSSLSRSAILCGFLFTTSLTAWGPEGHHLIARIADAHLSSNARAAVAGILAPGASMASVSTWADEVRPNRRESSPWHYINVPITARRSDWSPFCPAEGCIVRRINELVDILRKPGTGPVERQEALMYLIHFVGDLHQPLHAGDNKDRGGNDVKVLFFGQDSNLHRVWDGSILWKMGVPEDQLFTQLNSGLSAGQRKKWARGTVDDWLWESQELSRKFGYGKLAPQRPAPITDKYQRRSEPVVRMQLQRGGLRLASLLNEIFQ